MISTRTLLAAASLAVLTMTIAAGPAGAHTDSDVIAVPGGEEATVTLKPTHGCGDSPTIGVAIRVPVPGAAAVDVDGWTSSAEDDGQGRTVVEWTGGSLPTDQDGAFPVEFDVPADAVGELLTFPSIQTCDNGEELSWIDGDPEGEYPAPRLLVLPAGSSAAATIDEVPLDAPGRGQLVEIVDVDGGAPTTTTTTVPTTTSTPEETPTTVSTSEPDPQPTAATPVVDDDPSENDDQGLESSQIFAIFAAAVIVVVGGGLLLRTRMKDGPS